MGWPVEQDRDYLGPQGEVGHTLLAIATARSITAMVSIAAMVTPIKPRIIVVPSLKVGLAVSPGTWYVAC